MRKGGWLTIPAAFFFAVNFVLSPVRVAFLQQAGYSLFLVLLFVILRSMEWRRLLPLLTAGIAAILFSYGIVQRFVLFPRYLQELKPGSAFYTQALVTRIASGRIFSLFALPTLHALITGLLLIMLIHYALNNRGWRRTGWAVLALAGGVNLLLTQSFGGLLGFSLGLIAYLFLSHTLQIKFLAPLLMSLALVFFLVSALRFREVRHLQPARLRLSNWSQALRLIETVPLFGCGLGNYPTSISPHVRSGEQPSIYAHNFLLQLGAEIGLPALLLLLLLAAASLRHHLPTLLRADNAPFSALLLQILLYNLIDIGICFFAAGIALAIVLALLLPRLRPLRRLPLLAASILALLLLGNEISDRARHEGDLLLYQQENQSARQAYHRSLAINPGAWQAVSGLAQACHQLGDQPGERRALERLLFLYPSSPSGNLNYSRLTFQTGEYLTALHHAARASAMISDNPAAREWYEKLIHHIQAQLPADGN
jgi:tetratricopeptide (TPR) repeat protein